jgi:hypothetical protein
MRFVETMRDATTLNVNSEILVYISLESRNEWNLLVQFVAFKQMLSQEVKQVSFEIGNMHKERQRIENRLGELFSLMSRQTVELQVNFISNFLLYVELSFNSQITKAVPGPSNPPAPQAAHWPPHQAIGPGPYPLPVPRPQPQQPPSARQTPAHPTR